MKGCLELIAALEEEDSDASVSREPGWDCAAFSSSALRRSRTASWEVRKS